MASGKEKRGLAKIETKKTKKTKNAIGKHDFNKRRASLFKKANELAILCEAEVAIIILSPNGKIFEFASSNLQKILERFNLCLKSRQRPALGTKPENPEEQATDVALRQKQVEPKLKQWKLLGKDLTHMGLHELLVLREKLTQGMFQIKDTKMKMLTKQIEESKMQEQQALEKNKVLQGLVENLQGSVASVHNPALSIYFPETEGNIVGPSDRAFVPSISYAAASHSFYNASIREFLPSTSYGASLSIYSEDRAFLPSTSYSEHHAKPAADEEDSNTILSLGPTWSLRNADIPRG